MNNPALIATIANTAPTATIANTAPTATIANTAYVANPAHVDNANNADALAPANPAPDERHIPAKLYKAALQGELDRAAACMKKELRMYYFRLTTNVITPKGNSILHIHVAVPVHVRSVDVSFLNHFLEKNIRLLTFKNDRQETALHLAASSGQLKAVKLFLERDSSLLSLVNVDGDTALHMAAQNKHTSVVRYMLTLEECLGIINSTNHADETPFYLGVQNGSKDLVEAIVNKIDIHNGIPATKSILHAAVIWGNKDMVKKINDKYPELLKLKDEHGQTPIHYAAGMDNAILEALLQPESSTAVYIQDKEGRTAAHIAAQQNNVYGLKLLMKHFPDICEITDHQGRNIVHYSAFLGKIEALDYFLGDDEIQFSQLVNKKDNDKDTPLHLLVKSLENLTISLPSLERLKSLSPMLSNLQVMSYNCENNTPGDIASSIDFFNLKPDENKDAVRHIRKMAPKGGRVKEWIPPLQEYKNDIVAQQGGYVTNDMDKVAGTHMVVATLIATVSFTAGLTVPGGFNPETKNGEGGTAMLSASTTFQAFLFTDCFALASSLTAILCYFLVAVFGSGKRITHKLFIWAFRATFISIIMLMAAFLFGTYSFFQPSQKNGVVFAVLAMPVIIAICIMFAPCTENESSPRHGSQNNKLKWQVLHGHVTSTPSVINTESTLIIWLLDAGIILGFLFIGYYIKVIFNGENP